MVRYLSRLARKSGIFRTVAAAVTLVAVVGPCLAARGEELVESRRASAPATHELWLVSCRHGAFGEGDPSRLTYAAHRDASGWSPASQDDFRRSSPPAVHCVLVLGHGYTAAETQHLGTTIFRRLAAGLPPDLPVRFVIWSWPSDKSDTGPVRDLRAKAVRTPQVARSLARWLDETPLAGRVSLLGTSFGARIVMEALELRAGGRVGGVEFATATSAPRQGVNVVLISAAIDNDWLLPGRRLGASLSGIDRLLLINNRDDSVLNRYHWLYGRRSKAAALGVTGLTVGRLDQSATVQQIDAASIIGRQHGCAPYFDSPRLLATMRPVLFGEGPLEPSPLTPPARGETMPIARNTDRAEPVR